MASLKDYLVDGKFTIWITQTTADKHEFNITEEQLEELEDRLKTVLRVGNVKSLYGILCDEFGDPDDYSGEASDPDFNLFNGDIQYVLTTYVREHRRRSEATGDNESSESSLEPFRFIKQGIE